MKICKQCKTEKELSEFYVARENRDGRQTICKHCRKEINKTDVVAQQRKKANIKFMDKIGGHKGFYSRYKETIKKAQRSYAVHGSKKQCQHNYIVSDLGRKNNIEKQKRYRTRMRAAGGKVSKKIRSLIKDYYAPNNICPRCKKPSKIVIDHITPLFLGGTNDPRNLQPLCASCNAKKRICTDDYRFDGGKYAESLVL